MHRDAPGEQKLLLDLLMAAASEERLDDKSVPQFLMYLQIPLETGEEIAAKLMEKSA